MIKMMIASKICLFLWTFCIEYLFNKNIWIVSHLFIAPWLHVIDALFYWSVLNLRKTSQCWSVFFIFSLGFISYASLPRAPFLKLEISSLLDLGKIFPWLGVFIVTTMLKCVTMKATTMGNCLTTKIRINPI